jgi:hypothetical protein
VKAELEGLFRQLVRVVAEANIARRLLGVGYDIAGIALSAAANLV